MSFLILDLLSFISFKNESNDLTPVDIVNLSDFLASNGFRINHLELVGGRAFINEFLFEDALNEMYKMFKSEFLDKEAAAKHYRAIRDLVTYSSDAKDDKLIDLLDSLCRTSSNYIRRLENK